MARMVELYEVSFDFHTFVFPDGADAAAFAGLLCRGLASSAAANPANPRARITLSPVEPRLRRVFVPVSEGALVAHFGRRLKAAGAQRSTLNAQLSTGGAYEHGDDVSEAGGGVPGGGRAKRVEAVRGRLEDGAGRELERGVRAAPRTAGAAGAGLAGGGPLAVAGGGLRPAHAGDAGDAGAVPGGREVCEPEGGRALGGRGGEDGNVRDAVLEKGTQ